MRKIPTVDSWTPALRQKADPILLEVSPFEGDVGQTIGRDPRKIGEREFHDAGIAGAPLLAVIRAKCLDCCGEQTEEVRRCRAYACPNWPYRMGANPFRTVKLTEEDLAKRRERIAALNASLAAKRREIDGK